MLKEKDVPFVLREYTKDPLNEEEIRSTLDLLGLPAKEILRSRDPAYKQEMLSGEEPEDRLIGLMAKHPTLIQRPIALLDGKAMVARPADRLLEWIG